jgi:hypothetical protein
MKINVSKSAVLSNNKYFKPFYFFDIEIPSPEFYKYLGFNWCVDLKQFKKECIKELLKKAKFKVSTIAKHPVSPLAYIKLINSTVAPIFKYGMEVIPWNKSEINTMDTYLRKIARKMLSLPNLSNSALYSAEVNLVYLHDYRFKKVMPQH